MLIRGYVRTIKEGEPVPDGTEVRVYSHDTSSLIQTIQTLNGEYEHNFQGNPGPYWIEVEYNSEIHVSSSKVIGMSGPTNIGGIPLLFNLWHDGYIPGVLSELAVTSTGVGMSVSVAGGAGIVQGILYDQSSALPLTIAAADTQPRIDVVALQVVPAFADDDTEGRARIIVKKGTPASSPTAASLTQTTSLYEIALAHVTVDIGASSIASNKVADARARSNVKIGDGFISTIMLANGAVTTPKIADSAITTAKIANGNVTTAKLADGSVTGAKIGAGQVTGGSGGNIGYRVVDLHNLADNPIINATKIIDGAVTTSKIANLAVTAAKIASNTITAAQIATNAITGDELAANSVTTGHIVNGTITEDDLATAVKTKLNGGAGAMVTRGDRNHTKTNYTASGDLGLTHTRSLTPGTYEWFAIGHLRCTGEASSTQVKGWLRILVNNVEEAALPFYTTADPYGIGVDVSGGGTFTVASTGNHTFKLNWSRDTGTLTANSRAITVGIQKVS